MGRLRAWGAAIRRNPWRGLAVVALAGALVAGVVLVATHSGPSPSPPAAVRAVALGDSVPYGHGLANPYLTPQIGLPRSDVSQGPSALAYPSTVAAHFGLPLTVRPTNCRLVGDQLAISGAVASGADNTEPSGQCLPQQNRMLDNEIAASGLTKHGARLVMLQDGADDIHFGECLEYELARVLATGIGLGTNCVDNGTVTPAIAADLSRVRRGLASAIEQIAPDAGTVAVLDYYQPIPAPTEIADDSGLSGLGTNLVCTGLKANASSTDAAAHVVLTALNASIAGAVTDARGHGVHNVVLVDVAHALDGHGVCTADPWVFSAESITDASLALDTEQIVAARACAAAGSALHTGSLCNSLVARSDEAKQSLKAHVWRTAHPTTQGQRALAAVVERALRDRV
ncbi:MAG TPA: hypothetical protein VHY81_09025 [Acidimicrobiales bacterium]|nr:hypothetical protein [Acidimicrobiales bacterium]